MPVLEKVRVPLPKTISERELRESAEARSYIHETLERLAAQSGSRLIREDDGEAEHADSDRSDTPPAPAG